MFSSQAMVRLANSEVQVPLVLPLPGHEGCRFQEVQSLILEPNLGDWLSHTLPDYEGPYLILIRAGIRSHHYLGTTTRPKRRLARLQRGNHLRLTLEAICPLSYQLTREVLMLTGARKGWFRSSSEESKRLKEIFWRYKCRGQSLDLAPKDRDPQVLMLRAIRRRRLDTIRSLASNLEPQPIWYETLVRTGPPSYVLEVLHLLRLEKTGHSGLSLLEFQQLEVAFQVDLNYVLLCARRMGKLEVVRHLARHHLNFFDPENLEFYQSQYQVMS